MSEHGPKKELREVSVFRHRFEMSHRLEESLHDFFDTSRRAARFSGFYATRELVLDGYAYSQHRYHDFEEFNDREFQRKQGPILLGREGLDTPAIRFRRRVIGERAVTQVALRPYDQKGFNALIEAMRTDALDQDPELAPYDDVRPASGRHYLIMDIENAPLIEKKELEQRVRRFSFNVSSPMQTKMLYVRPDSIQPKIERRLVVPHATPSPLFVLESPKNYGSDDAA